MCKKMYGAFMDKLSMNVKNIVNQYDTNLSANAHLTATRNSYYKEKPFDSLYNLHNRRAST